MPWQEQFAWPICDDLVTNENELNEWLSLLFSISFVFHSIFIVFGPLAIYLYLYFRRWHLAGSNFICGYLQRKPPQPQPQPPHDLLLHLMPFFGQLFSIFELNNRHIHAHVLLALCIMHRSIELKLFTSMYEYARFWKLLDISTEANCHGNWA